jgi:hypothetical protein
MSRNEHKKKEGTVITNCSVTENVLYMDVFNANKSLDNFS